MLQQQDIHVETRTFLFDKNSSNCSSLNFSFQSKIKKSRKRSKSARSDDEGNMCCRALKGGIQIFGYKSIFSKQNYIVCEYSVVSIKQTGCNKRTGWSKNFI